MTSRGNRVPTPVLTFAIALLFAQDVYVPPVPIGVATESVPRVVQRPLPFPSEKQRWIRVRTPRFDVISSATAQRTEAIVSDLTTTATALMRTSSRFQAPAVPTTVLVFADRTESQPYFDLLFNTTNTRATGAYVRHSHGGTMIIDGSGTRHIERTAIHELVHDLLRQGELVPPLWVEEGLAEYFSTAKVDRNRVLAGSSVREHAALLRRRRQPYKLEELFAVEAETPAAAAPLFYAQSWAAVDWLMQLDRDAFYGFLQSLEHGAPVSDALSTHYGKTLDELESAIRRRGRIGGQQVTLESDPVVIDRDSIRELDRATLLYELGRFLSHVPGAEQEGERHLRAALELEPRHAHALSASGQHEVAVGIAPDDPEVLLAYAEELLSTAIGPFAGVFESVDGDADRFRKARELASRALSIHDDGRTRGLLGTTWLIESDFAEGIAHLEKARALLPSRMDFALNLYAMLLRSGDDAKATTLFASAFERSRDRQIAFAARNVRLMVEVDRANAYARTGNLDEAVVILRRLAENTPDANARRELESEAARLESTALVNRHITMYNEAVALATANRKSDALKILGELLQIATDPLVIRDAKQLEQRMRKR